MKKPLFILLAIGMVFGLWANKPTVSQAKVGKVRLVLATAGAGTGIYLRFAAITEAIRREAPHYMPTLLTGTTKTNLKRLDKGSVDITFINTPSAQAVHEGAEPYGRPIPIRLITKMGLSPLQLMVTPGTNLTSVSDMIKKRYPLRVSVGRKFSDPSLAVEMALRASGMTFKDFESWGGKVHFLSTKSGTGAIADNLTDAYFHAGSAPEPYIIELSRTREMRMLLLEKEAIAKMVNKGFERVTIPPGTYNFVKKNTHSVAMTEMLICRPGLPEKVVYTITKAIWESKDYLTTAHKRFKYLSQENMSSRAKFVPLHPGAKKFYKEIGWLK